LSRLHIFLLSCFALCAVASMEPRMPTRTCSIILVSPMIVLCMNHQNYTWTNGYDGHVRYNLPLFGDLWQHNQSKHKFAKINKIEPLTLAWMLTICRMELPGPTTSVGTRTDYSVGPWDYSACATRHLMAWGARTTVEKNSNRKLHMSCTM
jgi:hypothetical protein